MSIIKWDKAGVRQVCGGMIWDLELQTREKRKAMNMMISVRLMKESCRDWRRKRRIKMRSLTIQRPVKQMQRKKKKRKLTITKRTSLTRKITICIEQWCFSMEVSMKNQYKTLSRVHLSCMPIKCCTQRISSLMTTLKVVRKMKTLNQMRVVKLIYLMWGCAHWTFMSTLSIQYWIYCKWRSTRKL